MVALHLACQSVNSGESDMVCTLFDFQSLLGDWESQKNTYILLSGNCHWGQYSWFSATHFGDELLRVSQLRGKMLQF